MSKTLFRFFIPVIIIFYSKSHSNELLQLTCTNYENNSIHNFIIYPNYKVINILPNGYEFDYIIEEESADHIISYFYQTKDYLVKKFVLSFNLKENILYDEMYEGNDKKNLILKDKKIFQCKK